ncbi:rhodopsin-like [Athalia rosae]|uniref:rhodopsin-like n=1 Tax=Athalia rosae TaxID=37344 RepID=UPI000A0ED25B|nr:rhodopsin-like [Athalia rosae]
MSSATVLSNITNVITMENDMHLVSRSVSLATAGALTAIAVVGFFLNLTVIFVILRDTQTLLTPVNVVLLNLVIGDFCVSIIGTPFAIVSSIFGKWYWEHAGCLWYAWFMSTFGLASIGNLTVLAIERWLLITRPMKAFTIRQACYLVSGVWIYSLSLTIPPLFGWGSYGPEAGDLFCSVSWEVHDPEIGSDSYIAFLFIFGLLVPVTLITSSYLGIVTTLKKVRKRVGSRGRHEAQVTKMVAIMITAFLVAWTPYSVFALSAQYFKVTPTPMLAILPSLWAKSSICYNPVIYAGMNTQFRGSIKKFLGLPGTTVSRSAGSQHTAVSAATNRAVIHPVQILKK